jgi:hypothetical protein
VKYLVNRQHLLFIKTWRHSEFGSNLCKIRLEKHYTAFVKVVEGSEICNFPLYHFEHFYSEFLRKCQSNVASLTRLRRAAPRPRRCLSARAHRPRTCPPRPLLPHDRAHAEDASRFASSYRHAATHGPTDVVWPRGPPRRSVRPPVTRRLACRL